MIEWAAAAWPDQRPGFTAPAVAFRSEDGAAFFSHLKNQVTQIHSTELRAASALTNEHTLWVRTWVREAVYTVVEKSEAEGPTLLSHQTALSSRMKIREWSNGKKGWAEHTRVTTSVLFGVICWVLTTQRSSAIVHVCMHCTFKADNIFESIFLDLTQTTKSNKMNYSPGMITACRPPCSEITFKWKKVIFCSAFWCCQGSGPQYF